MNEKDMQEIIRQLKSIRSCLGDISFLAACSFLIFALQSCNGH